MACALNNGPLQRLKRRIFSKSKVVPTCDDQSQHSNNFDHKAQSLCDTCRALDFSFRKFTVLEPTSPIPSLESDADPLSLDSFHLGFLDSIYDRRWDCQFCRLIYDGARAGPKTDIRDDGYDRDGYRISCRIEWQLDTRASATVPVTRRLCVSTSCRSVPFFYVVPLAMEEQPSLSSMTVGCGKRITAEANLSLVDQWFQACRHHHKCDLEDSSSFWPSRLLDISNNNVKLVATPSSKVEYATLSYVWGMSSFLKLTMANYEALRSNPFPVIDGIPLTVQNAFHVVCSLGINFIWVDALCIIQDDDEDKEREIGIMDSIYRNSVLTVCAASGSSNDGISGVDGVKRHPGQTRAVINQFQVTALHPVADLIAATTWDSRGWTLQERLLSRRCVVFTPTETIWQCQEATWRESISLPFDRGLWTLDFIHSPYKGMHENPLRRYSSCVEIYSGRILTFSGDRLLAFNGLGQDLALGLNSDLLWGLPRRYFDWAVLWEPRAAGPRLQDLSNFPSWGWCGSEHAVQWRLSSLSGALFDLHSWLMTRTWVVWRSAERGSWKLVWDSEQQSSDFAHRGRWEGYLSENPSPYGRSSFHVNGNIGDFYDPENTDAPNPMNAPSLPPSKETQLAFTTFTGFFHLSEESLSTATFSSQLGPGLRRFGIVNRVGDWCGTVVLGEEEWTPRVGGLFEFAAISTARDFSMEEMDTWNYYIPDERDQSDWYCYYALMIRPVKTVEDELFERVGLAKIFRSAFLSGSVGGFTWKTVLLQ